MKLIFLSILFSFSAQAQDFSAPSISPSGISGSAGVGFVRFSIKDPNPQSLSLSQGTYASIGGEKGVGAANLYLNFSINYLKTEGQSKYSLTNAAGTYTSSTLVDFDASVFQACLGLKLKLLNGWFHPYVMGGGLFGYFGINYKNLSSTSITGPDQDYKTSDSIFDFGYFEEAGLEIAFSPTFGVQLAARMTQNKTQPFETLANAHVRYDSQVYFLNLLKKF